MPPRCRFIRYFGGVFLVAAARPPICLPIHPQADLEEYKMSNERTYLYFVNGQLVEVSKDVYKYLRQSDRRIKYLEHDVKIEIPIKDQDGRIIGFVPSKEDSLDRLMENGKAFADQRKDVQSEATFRLMGEKLRRCLAFLSEEERDLILSIYGEADQSERQIARDMGVPQRTLNDRKRKILVKLHKLMKL